VCACVRARARARACVYAYVCVCVQRIMICRVIRYGVKYRCCDAHKMDVCGLKFFSSTLMWFSFLCVLAKPGSHKCTGNIFLYLPLRIIDINDFHGLRSTTIQTRSSFPSIQCVDH